MRASPPKRRLLIGRPRKLSNSVFVRRVQLGRDPVFGALIQGPETQEWRLSPELRVRYWPVRAIFNLFKVGSVSEMSALVRNCEDAISHRSQVIDDVKEVEV